MLRKVLVLRRLSLAWLQGNITETKLAIFKGKEIRRVLRNNEEWWFSVVDVCAVFNDSRDAGAYWRKLKQRLNTEGREVVTIVTG